MLPTYTNQDNYISYKKLVNLLKSNFDYNLQEKLIGSSSIHDIKKLIENIRDQQCLISEGSYEYTNEKYRKNIIILEALNHLVKLMEIRTYRLEPKSGALVNFSTAADKLKALLNPKDNRPDLSYFTADHLNIEEPIKVIGPDVNDVVASVTNAANQVAPEDNLKKAEVYVGVNDGNPNYTTPTNDALETELAGLTSVEIANIADIVKTEVKKEIASEISDAVLLAKRKNEMKKVNESEDYMNKKEVEDLLANVRKKIADQGRVVDDRLVEKERKLVALLKTYKNDKINEDLDRYIAVAYDTVNDEGERFYVRAYTEEEAIQFAKDHAKKLHKSSVFVEKDNGNEIFNGSIKEQNLGESTMTKPIIRKLLESEIEKAEIILGVKSITDDLQNMAEKISKMQIEDIAALTERLKAEFGVEVGEQFQTEVGEQLGTALTAIQSSKSAIDNKALALSGDEEEGMSAPPHKELSAPDEVSDELPGGTEEDMFGGHEAASGPEEEPLGRAKKESIQTKYNKLIEMKKTLERKGLTESKLYKQIVEKSESWGQINPKKKGMFDGKNVSELRAELAKLKSKKDHSKADTTKIRELDYAIRAKTGWGKVKESEMGIRSGKEILMDEGASRKHFRATAETLRHVENMDKRKELAKSHADEFKKMNPRFSHQKFYDACGIVDECDSNGQFSPMSMSTPKFESVETRRMGNPEHMAKKEVNPTTPKNTAKVLNPKAVNVIKAGPVKKK